MIEVGEYFRSHVGVIGKIVFYDEDTEQYVSEKNKAYNEIAISKHSKDIKKLLEEGDFVNSFELGEFFDDDEEPYLGIPIFDDAMMNCIVEVRPLDTIEIHSIVTRQQFKEKEYII